MTNNKYTTAKMPLKKKFIKRRKKPIAFERKCESLLVRQVVCPLEKPNHLTASSTSKTIAPCKLCRSIRRNSNNKNNVRAEIRLCSPFNSYRPPKKDPVKSMPYDSPYTHVGLSPKEKSYLIRTFQTNSNKYKQLKKKAANAIESNQIFTIYGSCSAVRKALIERGWVEKITSNKMNLSRIRNGSFSNSTDIHNEQERLLLSNLVEKCPPNFIWEVRNDHNNTMIDMSNENSALVNKLTADALWTSKQGLCSSMNNNYWFYIDNVAEVIAPRTYNSSDTGDIENFVKDFRITACTSLLKWIVSMVANERPIFVDNGTIPMNIMAFALNRCKEYLFKKQNKDIDRPVKGASIGQWMTFLKTHYTIIAREAVFTTDKHKKLPRYLNYAKFLLEEMHKYRPQLSCEGCHNIWIVKPSHCSRGRGITMASKLSIIMDLLHKDSCKYVIQKYIEEPLLIRETKFDIRQYYLVTSTYPLVIWMYKDCYLKFSSQKYTLRNYHESIHLTNNAVQKKYTNCPNRHSDLPENNMWSLEKYREYLNMIGKGKVWDKIIYPGMKKSIVGIMLACQDSLSVSKNRYELYGCDFILDKSYKPWLIEINSGPDLNATTSVTGRICPAVIRDIIKVVVDYAHDSSSSTGKFERIYYQSMTIPRYGGTDLVVRGYSLSPDYFYKGKIIIEDSYENVDVVKVPNIKKNSSLRQDYEYNIMAEPDEDSEIEFKKDASEMNTKSEFELDIAANVVNDELNKLIEHVAPACNDRCNSVLLATTYHKNALTSDTSTKSETSFQYSQHFDSLNVSDSQCNELNMLDCKPAAKSSFKLRRLIGQSNALKIFGDRKSYEDLLKATNKIVSFINKKEKENMKEMRILTRKLK